MSAPKIHRVVSGSKGARQLMARQGRVERGPGLTPEQIEWNARIERERAARKAKSNGPQYFTLTPCCTNEKRNMNGGCDNCGDPCL